MSLLIWLGVSSIFWGAALWLAGRVLQRFASVSGRTRQWFWRGATALLVAPWIAAPFVLMFGLGLAPPETIGEVTFTAMPAADAAALNTLNAAATQPAVVESGGTVWTAIGALSLGEIVLLAVIAGWLVRFVMAQMALRSLLGIVMLSRKVDKGVASDSLRKWSSRLKLRRTPRLRVVGEQHSPFSYGMMRATVCLPEGLEDKLSRQSLDLVVGHECLHVARGDGWMRPLERVTADVLWFNPFAWLIRRELDVARELAVDEAVVAMADSRIAYARTLRDVAGISAGLSIAAPAASMSLAGGRNLVMRVSRTLAQTRAKPAPAAIVAACLMGLVAAPMAIAQVMLVAPAPPAPPAAPAVVAAVADAPAPPAPAAAPQAPEPPEAPAAAEFDSSDGSVRTTFAARVVEISGNATSRYGVELLGVGPSETGEMCMADMQGLGSLTVVKGQILKEGEVVGRAPAKGSMRLSVTCSDELDGRGYPISGPAPEPPQPPQAPTPVSTVAPAAPVAPAFPAAAPAPLAAPRPLSPVSAVAPAPPWAVSPAPYAPTAPLSPQPPAPYKPSSVTPPPSPAPLPLREPKAATGQLEIKPTNIAVLSSGKLASAYGLRSDPVGQGQKLHSGVDVAAARGVLIHTPADARVVRTGMVDGYGNLVELLLDNGYVLRLSQMDEIMVSAGVRVVAGEVVGAVGSSGLSTGPHLHLEVLVDGKSVNPESVKGLKLVASH